MRNMRVRSIHHRSRRVCACVRACVRVCGLISCGIMMMFVLMLSQRRVNKIKINATKIARVLWGAQYYWNTMCIQYLPNSLRTPPHTHLASGNCWHKWNAPPNTHTHTRAHGSHRELAFRLDKIEWRPLLIHPPSPPSTLDVIQLCGRRQICIHPNLRLVCVCVYVYIIILRKSLQRVRFAVVCCALYVRVQVCVHSVCSHHRITEMRKCLCILGGGAG